MKLPLPQSLPPHVSVGRGKCKFDFTQTFSPFHFQLGGFNKLLHHGQCQEQQSQTGVHLKEQGPHCCMSAAPRHSWEVTDPFWRGSCLIHTLCPGQLPQARKRDQKTCVWSPSMCLTQQHSPWIPRSALVTARCSSCVFKPTCCFL